MKLSPEFQLALACCRSSWTDEALCDITELLPQVDWATFLRIIGRHRIQTLVAAALRKSDASPPAAVARQIAKDCAAIAERNLLAARESLRLLEAFRQAGIPLLFVKGLTLSALAYGDPYLKMSADIDVLIEPGALAEAAELLNSIGYRVLIPVDSGAAALSKWHQFSKESVWQAPNGAASVDLHTRLPDNPALIPDICATSPSQLVSLGMGRSLPTLTCDDLFAYLSVHGASSAWFRLKWIVDLASFIHRAGPDQTRRFYSHANSRRAGRAAAQALLLADRLSLIRLPNELRCELKNERVHRRLVTAALGQLIQLREPTERFLGTASIHWTQLLLMKEARLNVSELWRQASKPVQQLRFKAYWSQQRPPLPCSVD